MRKVNYEERTAALNQFRMNNLNKTFDAKTLNEELQALGFSRTKASRIAAAWFPFSMIGKERLYEVPKNPIHKDFVRGLYKSAAEQVKKTYRNKKNQEQNAQNEQEALELLASKGYQIRRCIGFDIERFKKEQPVLYQKYLKYETV